VWSYSCFSDVNDIDLFTGALAETPLKGAVVGPTIGCILAHQFSSLRKSDRFWYENDVPPSSFTKGNVASTDFSARPLITPNLGFLCCRATAGDSQNDAVGSHLREL